MIFKEFSELYLVNIDCSLGLLGEGIHKLKRRLLTRKWTLDGIWRNSEIFCATQQRDVWAELLLTSRNAELLELVTQATTVFFFPLKCIREIPAALFYSELVASDIQHCLMYIPVGSAFPVDGEYPWGKDFLTCHMLFCTHFVTTSAFLVLCYR